MTAPPDSAGSATGGLAAGPILRVPAPCAS